MANEDAVYTHESRFGKKHTVHFNISHFYLRLYLTLHASNTRTCRVNQVSRLNPSHAASRLMEAKE